MCLSDLRHTGPCLTMVQAGLREAGEVADARTAAALLHVQVSVPLTSIYVMCLKLSSRHAHELPWNLITLLSL
jgi:hypothetical protein